MPSQIYLVFAVPLCVQLFATLRALLYFALLSTSSPVEKPMKKAGENRPV
jgi:hypothetical protein